MILLPLIKRRRSATLQNNGKRVDRLTTQARLIWLAVLLLVVLSQGMARAQDTENDNPTGPSGDFNGEVTTAGSYDPFTGCIKRRVTDLTVPGSNGAYPLVFARTCNSNLYVVSGDSNCFGDGGNWRHSYQWTLGVAATGYNSIVTAYSVAYPDGAVVTYKPGRNSAPQIPPYAEYSNFWRGPSGTTDRLEVVDSSHVYLHTSDGGVVNFDNSSSHPSSIVDPNGAITLLTYQTNNPNYLAQVTEPGGRWLKFSYVTATYQAVQNGFNVSHSWTLLSQVQASTGQTVTYTEVQQGSHELGGSQIGMVPYYVLTDVSYDYETSVSPNGGNVHAYYSYNTDLVPATLLTATDPHYAGAMVNIRYAVGSNSLEEQNLGSSKPVSHLDFTPGSTTTSTSTETRGDKSSGTGNTSGSGATLTRTFTFGSTPPAVQGDPSPQTTPKSSLLTAVTDFEGHTASKRYYDLSAKDTNGKSFLMETIDAKGTYVRYQHEPLTGKTTLTTTVDNRTSRASWLGADDSNPLLPYYLYQTTDERGQTVTYHHIQSGVGAGTGLVAEIDYPDGGKELYQYHQFTGNGGFFYKVSQYQNKLNGTITYFYDQANHGGSGHQGLLTSVTRSYATSNGTATETTQLYYDTVDHVNQVTDPRSVTDYYQYNPRHQLTKVTHGADNTTIVYVYDDNGNRTSVQDELGHITTTYYDEYRRVTYTVVPVNAPMANNQQLGSRYMAFAYERRDNSNQMVGDAFSHTGSNWSVSWKPTGAAVQRIFSPNNWLTDEYDGMYVNGGQSPVVPAAGNGAVHLGHTYYANGQLQNATDAQGFSTVYGYDNCNRPTTVTDPLGHATTNTYYASGETCTGGTQLNCSGLLKSVTGPGSDCTYTPTVTATYNNYNKMGLVRESTNPTNGNSTGSELFDSNYDVAGNLTSQTDGAQAAGQHVTGYTYDPLGRKSTCTYPDGSTETWTYNEAGGVKTYQNRAGTTCTYLYDGRNRCYHYSWSDSITYAVDFEYYANGQVSRVNNGIADIHFYYDDSGALKQETEQPGNQSSALATNYTHDLDGNVDSITYPSGNYPCFSYDDQERCTGMYSDNTPFSRYDYSGNWLTGRWLYNHLYTAYGHQNNGRVTDVWHYHVDVNGTRTANVRRHCYGYAPNGQISWVDREADGGASGSILENGCGDVFNYNPDGSLGDMARDVTVSSWPGRLSPTADSRVPNGAGSYSSTDSFSYFASYAYDAAGNRTQFAQTNPNTGAGFTSPLGADGENRYYGSAYDGNGNTTNSGVGWTYTYDAENHLKSATNATTGQSIAFDYDGLGRLIAQINNGVYSLFYYAGSQRIEERDVNNNVQVLYFFDAPGSDQILFRQGVDALSNNQPRRLWYQTDLVGNTTHLSAEVTGPQGEVAGQVVEQYLYDAYGTPSVYTAGGSPLSGSGYDNRYLFKSNGAYEWLSQAGLYYCRARFYLPVLGRFLQPDPIGQAGGLNIYAYCGNDPVNKSDSSGLDADSLYHSSVQKLPYDISSMPQDMQWAFNSTGQAWYDNVHGIYVAGVYQSVTGFEGYTKDNVAVAHAGVVTPGTDGYPNYPANQNYSHNPFVIVAIDAASVAEGILGNAIGLTLGAIQMVAGIIDFNTDAIKTGFDTFKSGLVPRYGMFAGPGWGIPETFLGQAPMRTPVDVGPYGHDVNYDNVKPLRYTDPEAWKAARDQADRQLCADVYAGPVGPFGYLYRLGILSIYGGH